MLRKLILAIGLICTTAPCWSAQENFSVTHVGIDVSQGAIFLHVSPASTSSTCADPQSFKWLLTTTGSREIYAAALSALAAGKTVTIMVNESTSSCINGNTTGAWLRVNG